MNQNIHREISGRGSIPFACFMELALQSYYENQKGIGRSGDFYTSVSVGPVFAELLALQFAEWTANLAQIQIVETGAHQGQFAADLLRWFRQWQPKLFACLQYIIVEPSATRRQWQQETLREFTGHVTWLAKFPAEVTGIIFTNELLDAMPVHRLCWHAAEKRWLEWHVVSDGENFIWQKAEPEKDLVLPEVHPDLQTVLPDGFIHETSPAAIAWWREAAQSLQSGKIITLDYGLTAEEFFQPERGRGTLRAYHRHRVSDDLLANPGEQDLTAHINFTAMQAAGESTGLKTEAFIQQSKFLTQIFEKTVKAPATFPVWNHARIKQFQTLTHPSHLGRFQVLIQTCKP